MTASRIEFSFNELSRLHSSIGYLEQFHKPFIAGDEERRFLAQFGAEVAERTDVALVIGRFQPLHYGHIYLMKQALEVSKNIIIGIGSANARNQDNPWTVVQREFLVHRALQKEGLNNRIIKVVRINDYSDDKFWLAEALRKTGEIDMIVGNNGWVNEIFINAGYKALEVPLLHRENGYRGKDIRNLLRAEGKLRDDREDYYREAA